MSNQQTGEGGWFGPIPDGSKMGNQPIKRNKHVRIHPGDRHQDSTHIAPAKRPWRASAR